MSLIIKYVQNCITNLRQQTSVNHCKMVIVVRKDISMSPGKIAAQCSHAAIECYRQSIAAGKFNVLCNKWLLTGQPKVILQVRNKAQLMDIYSEAKIAGLVTTKIIDSGSTELRPGTVTAIGIGPGDKAQIDKITGKLRIL